VILPSYNYLADRFEYFGEDYGRLFWGAIAAYNCGAGNVAKAVANGQDPDSRTTGRDYSWDVRRRALELMEALA
jgi:soluble lytic murein transglycosylase-like protein